MPEWSRKMDNKIDKFNEERQKDLIIGRNAVTELIKSGREIDTLFVMRGEKGGSLGKIIGECREKGAVVKEVDKKKLDFMCGHNNHQGVAAICAAPLVFGDLGILEGRKATIYPGMEEELKGAESLDFPVVRDMNIITSQGPATAMKFAIALVSYFKGKEVAEELEEDLLMI